MEYLLVAGLIIIIGGSLALAFLGGTEPPPPKPSWQCQQCQHTFEPPPVTEPPVRDRTGLIDDVRMKFLDCPKCEAKESCLPMSRCAKCGMSYVSEPTRWRAKSQKANPNQTMMSPQGKAPKNICPHCKTDQRQWRRKNSRKSRR
jgi:hypothetical protein